MLWYKQGIIMTFYKIRYIHDVTQITDICFQAGNLVFVKHTARVISLRDE